MVRAVYDAVARRDSSAVLGRTYLTEHLLRSARRDSDLVFGASGREAFSPRVCTLVADEAWKAAGLERLTLHECRHTYASYMIAAGVNAKAISTYMGHSSIKTTYDEYGHLMSGNEGEAADLLGAFLERHTATVEAS